MSTVIVEHIGIRGDKGLNAQNGIGVDDVRASLIESPLLKLFRPNKISPLLTWTRNDEAAIADRYGNQVFVAGDEIRHRLAHSNDFDDTIAWADLSGVWTRDTTNEADPFGGNDASQITFGNTNAASSVMLGNCSALGGDVYRVSLYAKVISGTVSSVEVRLGGSAGNNFVLSPSLTSNWQRIDVLAIPSVGTSTFNLNFRTTGAVIHLYQVNMTAGHILYAPYTTGASTSENIANTLPVFRENNLGYCIEGEKTNLCPFSQNIAAWQLSGSPLIEANILPDAYGDVNTLTKVVFAGGQSISLSQTVAITENETYSVSFFAVANQGSVESLNVQLGGGVVTSAEITTGYTRQVIEMQAGGSDAITFSASSSVSGSSFILTGVQVELGEPSSYIPTGTSTQTRDADLVSYPSATMPALNQPFTLRLAWSDVSIVGDNKTLLNAGILIELDGSTLNFDGVSVDDAVSSGELIAVYTGASLVLYIGGVEAYNAPYKPPSSVPVTSYVGQTNAIGDNALNGYMRGVDWWDFAMTQSEIEFISEADNGNRNS